MSNPDPSPSAHRNGVDQRWRRSMAPTSPQPLTPNGLWVHSVTRCPPKCSQVVGRGIVYAMNEAAEALAVCRRSQPPAAPCPHALATPPCTCPSTSSVDHPAYIINSDEIDHLDHAGLLVDFDFGRVGIRREGEVCGS